MTTGIKPERALLVRDIPQMTTLKNTRIEPVHQYIYFYNFRKYYKENKKRKEMIEFNNRTIVV